MRGSAIHLAYLGLGSNLPEKYANLRRAGELLQTETTRIVRMSSLYRTSPVDYLQQDWFLNQILEVKTDLSPEALLDQCLQVENRLGRQRQIPKGPRVIDIDLLFYDDLTLHSSRLVVPHPRIAERKFVLVPMAEIAPGFLHPVLKKTMRELLAERAGDPATVLRA